MCATPRFSAMTPAIQLATLLSNATGYPDRYDYPAPVDGTVLLAVELTMYPGVGKVATQGVPRLVETLLVVGPVR